MLDLALCSPCGVTGSVSNRELLKILEQGSAMIHCFSSTVVVRHVRVGWKRGSQPGKGLSVQSRGARRVWLAQQNRLECWLGCRLQGRGSQVVSGVWCKGCYPRSSVAQWGERVCSRLGLSSATCARGSSGPFISELSQGGNETVYPQETRRALLSTLSATLLKRPEPQMLFFHLSTDKEAKAQRGPGKNSRSWNWSAAQPEF